MGQGRFGHDRILSGVIMCHLVGNNGVFPERGSRGPCVGFWGPGSIWQRMWYFCAKFLWIKGVFYHGLCVIIYAGRIVPCLHWYLIRVIGRMTSLEWFSIWEASNNIINFNDVRKRLWKLIWLSKVFLLEIRVDWKGLYARSYWLSWLIGTCFVALGGFTGGCQRSPSESCGVNIRASGCSVALWTERSKRLTKSIPQR